MMHWYGDGMGWWGAIGAVLLVALFWALVLGSVVVLVVSRRWPHLAAGRAARIHLSCRYFGRAVRAR